jgi:malic enzyme
MNMNRSKLPSSTNPTPLKKSTTTFRTNGRPQPPLPIKNGLVAPSLKLSTSVSQTRSINKSMVPSTSTNSLNNTKISSTSTTTNKTVPPVPPRKSSIPRPSFNGTSPPTKPPPPQRNSSTNLHLHKPHISHL